MIFSNSKLLYSHLLKIHHQILISLGVEPLNHIHLKISTLGSASSKQVT